MVYAFRRRSVRTYKKRSRVFKSRRRFSTFNRRRRTRRTLKKRVYHRRRRVSHRRRSMAKTIVTRTFKSLPGAVNANVGSETHRNPLSFNPHQALQAMVGGQEILTNYAGMYDEFKCTQVIKKIWLDNNTTHVQTSKVPYLTTVYDPDAAGRPFKEYDDFIRCQGKTRWIKPYKALTMRIFPRLDYKMDGLVDSTANSNPWIDIAHIHVNQVFQNGLQYWIGNMSNAIGVKEQYTFTYKFRGLRNMQAYGQTYDSPIIPLDDSQNIEVNENFEMLNCDE